MPFDTPAPEERGDLDPPKRPPRTAVGVATPPPPKHSHRSTRFPARRPYLRPAFTSLGFVTGGGILLRVQGLPFQALGWMAVSAGVLLLGLFLWVHLAEGPLELRR